MHRYQKIDQMSEDSDTFSKEIFSIINWKCDIFHRKKTFATVTWECDTYSQGNIFQLPESMTFSTGKHFPLLC